MVATTMDSAGAGGSVGVTASRGSVRRAAAWGFLSLGYCLSVLGTALPGVRDAFGLTLSDTGIVVVVNAVGYLVSVLLGGLAADRWGRRPVLVAGAATLAAGIALFAVAPTWPLALAGITLVGAGEGAAEGALNALISEHSGDRRGADLNLAHGVAGIGAVLGPIVAGAILAAGLTWRWLYVPAALVMLWLVWAAWRLPLGGERRAAADHEPPAWNVLRAPVVWLLSIILCLYAGVEMMVGTWSFSHLQDAFGAEAAVAGIGAALYWGGITIGRLLIGAIGGQLGPHRLIVGNIVAALVALLLMVAAPTLAFAAVGLLLVGLTLANIYPAAVAVAGAAYPRAVGSVTGMLVAAGGLGTAIFPWVTGMVAEDAGLATALGGGVALLLLMLVAEAGVIGLQRRARIQPPVSVEPAADWRPSEPPAAEPGEPDQPGLDSAGAAVRPAPRAGRIGVGAARRVAYVGAGVAAAGLVVGVAFALSRRRAA
jgi:fucose permease